MNDSITPQPDYTLDLQNNDRTIKLAVKSAMQKPYLYDDTRVESHEWSAYTRYALRVCGPIHDFTNVSGLRKWGVLSLEQYAALTDHVEAKLNEADKQAASTNERLSHQTVFANARKPFDLNISVY